MRILARFAPLSVLVILLPLAGCGMVRAMIVQTYLEPDPPDAPAGVVAYRDNVFAVRGKRQLLLDVYAPKERGEGSLPVLIFLFGGGWESGNRHQAARFGLIDYATDGYVVVTADYRYLTEAVFPAQIADVKAAVRWVRSNAADYGIDAGRIGVIGPSAGGHLAALAGTANRPGELDPEGAAAVPSHVHAVVDYFGPTDFLQGDAHRKPGADPWSAPDSTVSRLIGAPIESAPDKVARANPITFIDGSEPPFLIVHGEDDGLVPLHQSRILHEALLAAGVSSELLVVAGGDHGYGGDFSEDEHFERVRAFFGRHLRAGAR